MKHIGQTERVEDAQHLRRVGALHVVGISHRALQDEGARRRDDHGGDQQYDAGLDRAECLPDFFEWSRIPSHLRCPSVFLSPLRGWSSSPPTQGLRPGLHSVAASRL